MTLSTTSPGDERTPTDYALEHAEYMAMTGEQLLEAMNQHAEALMALEEADEPGDYLTVRAQQAEEILGEYMAHLRSGIYEFRKRRDRASSSTVQQVGAEWMPIDSAPKDGRDFIALVGGLPYMAHYDEFGRMVRMTHCNRRGYGRSYTTHQVDGKALIEILSEGEDDSYEVQGILWARNFNHKPTHWMPLPSFQSLF